MTIAHDAVANSGAEQTGDDSWTHTPVGTPAAALVMIVSSAESDDITSVTYGGVAMTRILFNNNSAAGPGAHWIYLLVNPPSGAQTVAWTTVGVTVKEGVSVTVTADGAVTHSGSGSGSANDSNPTVSISGSGGITYAALWKDLTNTTDLSVSVGTQLHEDFFSAGPDGVGSWVRHTGNPSWSDAGGADPWLAVGVRLDEVLGRPTLRQFRPPSVARRQPPVPIARGV